MFIYRNSMEVAFFCADLETLRLKNAFARQA